MSKIGTPTLMKPILSIQVTQQETGNGKLFVQRDICYQSDDAGPTQHFDASVGTPQHLNHQQYSQLKFIDTKILRKLALPIKEFNPLSTLEAGTQKKPEYQRPSDPYIRCFQAQTSRAKQQAPLTVIQYKGESESMSARGSRKGRPPPPMLFDVASAGGVTQGISKNRPRRSLTAEQQKLVQKHIKRVQSQDQLPLRDKIRFILGDNLQICQQNQIRQPNQITTHPEYVGKSKIIKKSSVKVMNQPR